MATDITSIYKRFLQCTSVSIDSRKVSEKGMFFALQGDNLDGNVYAADALANGCLYAVVDNPKFKEDDQYILVDNVLEALQQLGNKHRKEMDIPVLGITGSNGKTTTRQMTAEVVAQKFSTLSTIGNYNNQIGVPLRFRILPLPILVTPFTT